MGPLFWRLFIALWAGSALLMVGTAATVALRAEAGRPDGTRDHFLPMVRATATGALHADGDAGLALLRELETANGTAIYLVDAAGRERFGRAVPAPPAPPRADAFADPRAVHQRRELPGTVTAADGTTWRVVTAFALPQPPSKAWLLMRLAPPILISVLLAGVISALVARHLVSPLAKLRAATARFGAGELETRVGIQMDRKDEFAELAADFDRMAERIDRLIRSQRQLLLDLSHELRSPLARLRVALELSQDPAQAPRLLPRMERDVERMDVLIGELLVLARAEWTAIQRSPEQVDLGKLVDDIVDDARIEATQTGHLLDFRASPTPLVVRGDVELLRRAVENIVRNALQHTPAGSAISVVLSALGDDACIQVEDNGPGIAEDGIERLFTPFARGDEAASDGYGLGLAILRGAVLRHRGRIETRPGRDGTGLVVTICLPLVR